MLEGGGPVGSAPPVGGQGASVPGGADGGGEVGRGAGRVVGGTGGPTGGMEPVVPRGEASASSAAVLVVVAGAVVAVVEVVELVVLDAGAVDPVWATVEPGAKAPAAVPARGGRAAAVGRDAPQATSVAAAVMVAAPYRSRDRLVDKRYPPGLCPPTALAI